MPASWHRVAVRQTTGGPRARFASLHSAVRRSTIRDLASTEAAPERARRAVCMHVLKNNVWLKFTNRATPVDAERIRNTREQFSNTRMLRSLDNKIYRYRHLQYYLPGMYMYSLARGARAVSPAPRTPRPSKKARLRSRRGSTRRAFFRLRDGYLTREYSGLRNCRQASRPCCWCTS